MNCINIFSGQLCVSGWETNLQNRVREHNFIKVCNSPVNIFTGEAWLLWIVPVSKPLNHLVASEASLKQELLVKGQWWEWNRDRNRIAGCVAGKTWAVWEKFAEHKVLVLLLFREDNHCDVICPFEDTQCHNLCAADVPCTENFNVPDIPLFHPHLGALVWHLAADGWKITFPLQTCLSVGQLPREGAEPQPQGVLWERRTAPGTDAQ